MYACKEAFGGLSEKNTVRVRARCLFPDTPHHRYKAYISLTVLVEEFTLFIAAIEMLIYSGDEGCQGQRPRAPPRGFAPDRPPNALYKHLFVLSLK